MSSLSGQTIAGYEVIEKIGEGGMGAVYKARQPSLNRLAALKVMASHLATDAEFVARFKREATLAANLNHENIVLVYGAGTHGQTHYIAMEFVEGETLRQRIAKHGRIEPREAVAITVYVAQALQYAWSKCRLIHRDIKPDNIFVSVTGEIKVGDLGLAKSVGSETTGMTATGLMMGSPHYISPEQAGAKKDIDFRTDIYSLGCTLYHMLTGQPPYEGSDPLAVISKHVHEPPPAIFKVLPQCPMPLALMVGKMLAKKPHERPQSYEELIAQLREVHGKLAPVVKPPPASASEPTRVATPTPTPARGPERFRGWSPRFSVLWPGRLTPKAFGAELQRIVLAGAAVIVIAAVGLFIWSPWKQSGPAVPDGQSIDDRRAGRPAHPVAPKPPPANPKLGDTMVTSAGIELVYIPPGEFMMGSTEVERQWAVGPEGRQIPKTLFESGEPKRTRIKNGFWMGRTEVTVGQWRRFVEATGYITEAEKMGCVDNAPNPKGGLWTKVEGKSWRDPGFDFPIEENHPACCISWNDAVAFCRWLTESERRAGGLPRKLSGLPAGLVYRLPSEAEWEYACRGGKEGARFWWGDEVKEGNGRFNAPSSPISPWTDNYKYASPVDVFGERGRNGFGLVDMLGNAYEWCLDGWDPKAAHEEPLRKSSPGVLRGGSFNCYPGYIRCASRDRRDPSQTSAMYGFRLCAGVNYDRSGSSTVSSSVGATPTVSPASQLSTSPAAASPEGGILAPAETRVASLTANPKRGEVFTLPLGSNVTMELMGIPPGEYMLGSTKEEQAWAVANGLPVERVKREGEAPRKTRIKEGFWMGRTGVTVGQWKEFVAATGYKTDAEKKGCVDDAPRKGQRWGLVDGLSWRDPGFGSAPQDRDAVCCITWNDAMAFCEWATERERKAGRLLAGQVVRLPTEAEREYACRAGSQSKFWWGDSKEDGKDRLNWSGKADGFEFVSPVDAFGSHGRNGFGLADMLGNLYEWCLDGFDAKQAHEECYKGNPGSRMLRGGSFYINPATVRCAYRYNLSPAGSSSLNGFRICVGMDLSGTTTAAASTSPAPAPKATEVQAPAETRVPALTANPKRGEVCTLALGTGVTLELVGIPPGEFMLGSTKEEQDWAMANGRKEEEVRREGEAPRKATIKQGFWMGRTEVTVGQWKQFVKETGYVTDGEKKGGSYSSHSGRPVFKKGASWRDPGFGFEPQDNHPVSCVSWNDATAFCGWLAERERKAGRLADGCTVRLPTEAEWEYACRAGTQTKFWWGDSKEDGKGRLNWRGKTDGHEFVAPVDSFGTQGRNQWGLADMLGNVWEWCLDEYDTKQAHEECYRGNPRARAFRGGTFAAEPSYSRCAFRYGILSDHSTCDHGFRIVMGVDVSGATTTTALTSPAAAPKEGGTIAPVETRVAALTTNPKVGEVFTLPLGSNVTMELMGIPPGEFMLGSTKEEQTWAVANGLPENYVKFEGEAPRKATVKEGFWMGRTEVTVGQWKEFVTATGYKTDAEKNGFVGNAIRKGQASGRVDGLSWRDPGFGEPPQDNHPVCCVSWNDVKVFCEWATERERKTGRLAAGQVVRLPTEAEWEYACRAGRQPKFWWGENEKDGTDRLNWNGTTDGFEFTSPVDYYGARGRNRFGLADMLGNVNEWCLDEFDAKQAHEECYKGNRGSRVLRGGGFVLNACGVRCAYRTSSGPFSSGSHLGFRVVVGLAR